MVKAYKYVYYRIYLWSLKTYDEKNSPHESGVLGLILLTSINICTLLAILQGITDIEFLAIGALSKKQLLLPIIGYMALHYFILFHKKRYKQIIAEYSQESEEEHKKGTVWVIAYIVGTPVVLVISILIASPFA